MYLNINSECKYTHNSLINKLPGKIFIPGRGTVFAGRGTGEGFTSGRETSVLRGFGPIRCEKFHKVINSCYLYNDNRQNRFPKGINDD